jgi:hypothetical protein
MNRRTFLQQSAFAAGAATAAACFSSSTLAQAAASPASGENDELSLAYRIGPVHWQNDVQFGKLLDLLKKYRDGVDEISLFESETTSASLERIAQVAEMAGRRLQSLREAGFRPGINVLWTLGHGDIAGGPAFPFQAMVGHDGRVSSGCPCPNDAAFRDYVKRRYQIVARVKPAFLWVDDDFRMASHGADFPCFCPHCLEKFGREKDRAALVQSLNAPQNGALREAWTEFCSASLESLAADIGQAIREADPNVEIGLMTIGYSHSTYGGYPIGRWMKALVATRGRPGHGYYTDAEPRTILGKAMDVGRQIRDYPAAVRTIQYELENYPYILLDKSASTLVNECTLALMMGCTGLAFNALRQWEGNLEDYAPLLKSIVAEKPVWKQLRKAAHGLSLAGFWPADTPMLMARRNVGPEGWFVEGGLYDLQRPNQLAEMGVPFSPDRHNACGVILAGKTAEAFSDDDLRTMLAGGVLLDAEALDVLWRRGLGELTGVKLGPQASQGVCERLTDHPLNGRDRGDVRDTLAGPGTHSLTLVAPEAGSLATLVSGDGADCGCCFSVFANGLNGRVAVSTYSPWSRLGMAAKRRHLLAVADWLSNGRLPILIEETVRVAPFVRRSADGKQVAVVLMNLAFDPTGPLTVRLRAKPQQVSLLTADGPQKLPIHAAENEVKVEVPSIPAWHTAVLHGE